MVNSPIVTIGVASYNNASFVTETLDSIAAQTYPALALIILDDGSTDDSVAVIEQWVRNHAERFLGGISFLKQQNKGVTAVFNHILEICATPYISLIGSDDVMMPNRISVQVAQLEAEPEAMLAHSNYAEIDANGNLLLDAAYPTKWPPTDLDYVDALINGYHDRSIVLHSPTALYRRSVFHEVGFYHTGFVQEDLDMLLRIASRFSVVYHPDVLLKYRILPNSLSRSPEKQVRLLRDKITLLHQLENQLAHTKSIRKGLALSYLRLLLWTMNEVDASTRLDYALKAFSYHDEVIPLSDQAAVVNRLYLNDFSTCRSFVQASGWSSGRVWKDWLIKCGVRWFR